MDDQERERLRSSGVFLFENRVVLAARILEAQVLLTNVCAKLNDCDIDDDSDALSNAVARLFELKREVGQKIQQQRKELFPTETGD